MRLNLNWQWLRLAAPLLAAQGLVAAVAPPPGGGAVDMASPLPELSAPATVRAPLNLDDWAAHLPAPVAPTRDQLIRGDDGNKPVPTYTPPPPPVATVTSAHLPQLPALAPLPKTVSDDERLAAIAVADRDFFQALVQNPRTWSNEERDRRAQAIHDQYYYYLTDHPQDVNALVLYGKLLSRTGQNDMADEAFRHADALTPNLAVVKQQLANHLAEAGQYKPALELLRQATALAPTEPVYHYQIGELLNIFYEHFLADKIFDRITLNQTMAAEFARAAELAPEQPAYAWRHAESFYDMAGPDWKAALAAWAGLAKHTTQPALLEMIRLHCARALLELGQLDQAALLIDQPVLPALEASRLELAKRLAALTPKPDPAPASPAASAVIKPAS